MPPLANYKNHRNIHQVTIFRNSSPFGIFIEGVFILNRRKTIQVLIKR